MVFDLIKEHPFCKLLDNTDDSIGINSNEIVYSSANVKFSSNLSALLNDPRKERAKVNQIFTKTWGADFTDNPSFPEFTIKEFPIVTATDFKIYLDQTNIVSDDLLFPLLSSLVLCLSRDIKGF